MALHFYMNGTTGAQDGVEISNGDLSNPLLFDGFHAASGVKLSKTKTIHIRADAGETWYFVLIDIVITNQSGNGNKRFTFSGLDNYLYKLYYHDSNDIYLMGVPFFSRVGDVNIPITIKATVIGGEQSPDTDSKLVIISGVKYE